MLAKILIVDDEEVTRQSLQKIIEHEGYEVLVAEGGQKALQLLEKEDVGVMLLDVVLPDMDGFEVMRQARQVSPDTRVVLITGQGSLDSAIKAIRNEAFDYILKPPSVPELLSAIARGLKTLEEEKRRRLILAKLDQSLHELKEAEGLIDSPRPQRNLISMPDGVTLDLTRRELWRGNQSVRLTPSENKLMEVFVRSWGSVLSHADLLFLLQGYEANPDDAPEVLRPLISRLRRKLRIFPNGERWITSVRGRGYVFDADRPSG